MAVSRVGNVLTMSALNDATTEKLLIQKVVHSCSAAPFVITLSTGAAQDKVFFRARGAQNSYIDVTFDPPLKVSGAKLTAKGGDDALIYLA